MGRSRFTCLQGLNVFFWIQSFVILHTWLWISVIWTIIHENMRAYFSIWGLYVDVSNASINVFFEGLAMGAVSFGNIQLIEHAVTMPVHLVPSSLWVFSPPLFRSPILGAPRGPVVTKIILLPRGTTVSTGVCTPDMDRSVTMHGPCHESLSQRCCGFRIHIRVINWTFFGRITGRSRFTCLRGLYVFLWIW